MDIKLIIPARYKSTRLPGKPLVPILGVPMIKKVHMQCIQVFDTSKVFVATDDNRIKEYCEKEGIQYVMTSESCLTGTDRVAEAAQILGGDVFINVQGDEPIFNVDDIKLLMTVVETDSSKVYCGFADIKDEATYRSLSTPKMVFSVDNKLMYTSRHPIPGNKTGVFSGAKRQICAYSFPKKALDSFASLGKKTPLEELEDLELLRFLELGFDVYGIPMSDVSIPVDHPEDVLKVENFLKNV